jgi:hypothetical protein
VKVLLLMKRTALFFHSNSIVKFRKQRGLEVKGSGTQSIPEEEVNWFTRSFLIYTGRLFKTKNGKLVSIV